LPIQIKHKLFFFSKKLKRGRSKLTGQVLCRTKGSVLKRIKYPMVNKSYRDTSLFFIANIFYIPFKLKLFSLVFNASGNITYLYSSTNHFLFYVSKFYGVKTAFKKNKYLYLSPYTNIPQTHYMISQLPKNKLVSLLEIHPNKGIQYVKSSGSKSFLRKTNFSTNLALVQLPSGVRKVFSLYSVGSLGAYPFSTKKTLSHTKTNLSIIFGKKTLTRGVAKNPIDHPHGGRTKAIKYQRTP
jgi:large subunit ribosomal protein L2